MQSGSVFSPLYADCVHTPLCVGLRRVSEVLDTAVSTVSFVAVADFDLLDTDGLAPLSFVAVVDAAVSALSAM